MIKNQKDTVISIMSAGGHKVAARALPAGKITHEEAIQRVQEACLKLPTKIIRPKQDVQKFYEE